MAIVTYDNDPLLANPKDNKEQLAFRVTNYIGNTLLHIEDDEEKLKEWRELYKGISEKMLFLKPAVWSFLFQDDVIGEEIRKQTPEAEARILEIMRAEGLDAAPTRYNRFSEEFERFVNGRWSSAPSSMLKTQPKDPFEEAREALDEE